MPHPLDPINHWFEDHQWTPFPFQTEVWSRYLDGDSGLIHASTGSGKSYAAWMGALAEWIDSPQGAAAFKPTKRKPHPPIRVLWITPLRALAGDTAQALRRPLDDLDLPWSVGIRTGDTPTAERNRQRKRLPTALITTPESLSLMLTWSDAPTLFQDLQLVVVDEWHELLATKRGTQTELGLARLRRWNPALRTWGLSATMGNLDEALRSLIGAAEFETGEIREGYLVKGALDKEIVIESLMPKTMTRFPWAGHIGLKMLPEVVATIKQNRTTLVFCNTRHMVERWYQELIMAAPSLIGRIALHHGAIDQDTRAWVEQGLREATLKCVVCTSSLDLGVDFPLVDGVVQIGSPKGVARLVQRAGRSGHQPGLPSKITCVPAHAFELLEISAAREAIAQKHIEHRPPVDNALDVLAQHLVTIGLGGGFDSAELYREVRTAYSYRGLSPEEWEWCLDFVTRGGEALQAYERYRKVMPTHEGYAVIDKDVARMHRMSIGTIMSDTRMTVKYLKGGKLGGIEESFVSRLKPGDQFTFAGKVLEFVRLKDLTVLVRQGRKKKGVIPRWTGGKMPLSDVLSSFIRTRLTEAQAGIFVDDEMEALRPILRLQMRLSHLPAEGELLIERFKSREGHHLFFYPFSGRLVHEGLAALTAYRLSRFRPITFTMAANEYGFELLSPDPAPLEEGLTAGLFSTENLLDDIAASMNESEMARRQFREISRVSGLVYTNVPGARKSMRQIQASSGLLYDVLVNYDADNLLLDQAKREVLNRQLEESRLVEALRRMTSAELVIKSLYRASPMGFPLLVDRMRQTVSSETLDARVLKMVAQLEKSAGWK